MKNFKIEFQKEVIKDFDNTEIITYTYKSPFLINKIVIFKNRINVSIHYNEKFVNKNKVIAFINKITSKKFVNNEVVIQNNLMRCSKGNHGGTITYHNGNKILANKILDEEYNAY